jgi:hypothetical protein
LRNALSTSDAGHTRERGEQGGGKKSAFHPCFLPQA